ncbi:SH3 domain-containing protein [Leptolyngbya sp. GB1-A1]|uniref:hypothetical protein n=1 Tax=Leptolyngbya sp. GB1-A1 TaxID=2933908 RepID=UPI003296A96B
MKLSKIVFLSGLSSLALSNIAFWQRSNAVPVRQTYQVATIAQLTTMAPSPTAPTPAAPVQPATSVPLTPAAPTSPVAPAVPTASSSSIAQANLKTIATCNGQPENANFRSIPSLAPGAVLGVVAQGEVVALTGRTAIGDGEFWYEAIAPKPLFPSANPAALNRTQAGQTGWISACFIGR